MKLVECSVEIMTAGEMVKQNVPKELVNFFRSETGRTFIIKGKPRCGKTTFALQIATDLVPSENIFYIATRGSNQPLYGKYNWLKSHDEKMERLKQESLARPAGQGQKPPPPQQPQQQQPQQPQEAQSGQKPTSARALLESILEDTASAMQPGQQPVPQQGQQTGGQGLSLNRNHLDLLLQGVDHKELEAVYLGVENAFPQKTMLMINRIDRLGSRYGVDMESLVKVLKRDLVMDANTNLILVLNKIDSGLDHLADGIITLKEFGGGMVFIGQLEINKLSGVEINQDKYLYNLLDGKFKLLKGITHWG